MTFARKIFLSVFLTTFVLVSLLIWVSNSYVSEQTKERYISRYSIYTKVLADTLTQLDYKTEDLMLNAAKVIQGQDAERGLLSTANLKVLRDDLKMSHIFIADDQGTFVRSTNENPQLIPNLYSFCGDYKKLVTGDSLVEATPVIGPDPEPKPYKFLSISSRDRKRIIEVGVRVDFIGSTLAEASKSDANVISMSLYSPNGSPFGLYNSSGVVFDNKKAVLPSEFSSAVDNGDSFSFFAKVTSSHTKCCQCDVAGTSRGGEYYYVLESKVSKNELNQVLASTTWVFIILGCGNIILSLLLSHFLSQRLVKNIERAVLKVREIKVSGDLRDRLQLHGHDEVAYLTAEFDNLLEKLEDSHYRVIEAERVEARVQQAREVAHNIKSPALAIEAMLPLMLKLPKHISKTLKSSSKEIKGLVEKLNKISACMVTADKKSSTALCYLPSIIDELVSQKQFEYTSSPRVQIMFNRSGEFKNAFVNLDALDFKSILSNLINNAVDSYGGGIGEIKVSLAVSAEMCSVSVTDKGGGIPRDYVTQLGHKKITFKGSGTRGLGLSHAFKVIDSWGGKVSIESELGVGTVIKINLPLAMVNNAKNKSNIEHQAAL